MYVFVFESFDQDLTNILMETLTFYILENRDGIF